MPLYNDVRGTVRPTGRTCFAAEELTSDDYGKAAGLVFSEALEGVISRGSEKTLQREFEELPPLTAGAAIGLRRFARRMNAKRQFKHPLIERLFGPTSTGSFRFEEAIPPGDGMMEPHWVAHYRTRLCELLSGTGHRTFGDSGIRQLGFLETHSCHF